MTGIEKESVMFPTALVGRGLLVAYGRSRAQADIEEWAQFPTAATHVVDVNEIPWHGSEKGAEKHELISTVLVLTNANILHSTSS